MPAEETENMTNPSEGSLSMVVAAGCVTVALLSALFLVKRESSSRSNQASSATGTNDDATNNKKTIDRTVSLFPFLFWENGSKNGFWLFLIYLFMPFSPLPHFIKSHN